MVIKLKDGYEVSINESCLNDWNMLRLLRQVDKGESAVIVDVVDLMLGADQSEALAKHLEVDGVTPIDAMVDAMREIMEAATELKNS